ncbi:hypothetical protein ACL03H_05920 [Saccharopolyspora sp. MS10]|uniref:hypothetical protein n=1 Tax=Saccharopolyspora sp. MS10 TaxID=3385973 RepID=UPI0039A005DF
MVADQHVEAAELRDDPAHQPGRFVRVGQVPGRVGDARRPGQVGGDGGADGAEVVGSPRPRGVVQGVVVQETFAPGAAVRAAMAKPVPSRLLAPVSSAVRPRRGSGSRDKSERVTGAGSAIRGPRHHWFS